MNFQGALCALLLLVPAATLASASSSASPQFQASARVSGVGVGPMMCVDCESPTAMSVTLCHSASVQVTIGGSGVGSFSTGQSTSACVTAPAVQPDSCVWMEYHYTCVRGGFFGLWQCTSTGANVKTGGNPYC